MLFEIRHSIRFSYERPVFLEPMIVRLSPRQDVTQRLISHELTVTEAPAGHSLILEPDGTDARVLWFSDKREHLHLQVHSVVETLRCNPFDWILTHPQAQRLPASYPAAEAASLAPSLSTTSGASEPGSNPVGSWAAGIAAEVEHSTPDFLMRLADDIHHGFHHIGRLDGEPLSPEDTLSSRCGACRDTAMLYVKACRSQGLAARFVSGYSMHHPPEVSEHELHAWAEVYLPGGGWRGYDPSLGLAVADGHVALAASPDHLMAAPTTGTYRGTDVGSQLSYTIELKVTDPEPEPGEAAASLP
jgi:transglutaminase-like putative cysteine protease